MRETLSQAFFVREALATTILCCLCLNMQRNVQCFVPCLTRNRQACSRCETCVRKHFSNAKHLHQAICIVKNVCASIVFARNACASIFCSRSACNHDVVLLVLEIAAKYAMFCATLKAKSASMFHVRNVCVKTLVAREALASSNLHCFF